MTCRASVFRSLAGLGQNRLWVLYPSGRQLILRQLPCGAHEGRVLYGTPASPAVKLVDYAFPPSRPIVRTQR